MRRRLIPFNPMDAVEKPGHKPNGKPHFTPEELGRILKAADAWSQPTTRSMVHVAACTALRIGEMLALAWEPVDLAAGTAWIDQSLSERRSPKSENDPDVFAITEPRTAAGFGAVPLSTGAVKALRDLRDASEATPHGTRLVFATEAGTPLRQSNLLRRQLHPLLDSAKVAHRGWHAFRHAMVTDALDAGANPVQVAALVGHARTSFTVDRYASPVEGGNRDVLEAVEAKRSERAGGTR